MDDLKARALNGFRLTFGGTPELMWAAPGRINLLGEHTDYNDGFVMPHAIGYYTVAAVQRSSSPTWRVHSEATGETITFGPTRVAETLPESEAVDGWGAYVAGAVWALRNIAKEPIGGARISIASNVPVGAGLSSSAALEVAVIGALCDLYKVEISREKMVLLAQEAENSYVGAPTGILDQTASLMSHADEIIHMDCRSREIRRLPFDLEERYDLTTLIIDTNAPHRLVDDEYADRRRDCERAAGILGVASLRDVTDPTYIGLPDLVLRRRVRHVLTENQRVNDAAVLLEEAPKDLPQRLGRLMTESHLSMMADYEITVPEVDLTVSAALRGGAVGARMTGGGFGGSVIALAHTDSVVSVIDAVTESVDANDLPQPEFYDGRPTRGAHRLDI
ncbi:MAG TPA: galactokinase [Stackebrandtia sp.]|uniref:galactokinase n=1 Tax=Stackebrandtia sp. TaxID=2023065 RepID=UPI002D4B06C2|nr:galactokinase [Stackebrandtia sp.]HZE38952.1 galactokinase [Stackebrandtia sp.]